jgi:hypothetical protein
MSDCQHTFDYRRGVLTKCPCCGEANSELPSSTCSSHGRAAAKKRPTTNCSECWKVWEKAKRERYEKRMTTPKGSGCVMRARFKE